MGALQIENGGAIVYYAYANDVTKQFHLHVSDELKLPNCHLLFVLKCCYTDKPLYSPYSYRPAIDGVYLTEDRKRIKVLDWAWYGLKYDS